MNIDDVRSNQIILDTNTQSPLTFERSFYVVNLGCKVNRVESDDITARLLAGGLELSDQNPGIVIVNTCTVTGEAEKKTRKTVRGLIRKFPSAKIIVTGCAAVINPQEFIEMGPTVQVTSKGNVVDSVINESSSIEDEATRYGKGFPTRVGVKVQDGCNNACTYCIVHTARGPEKSRPLASVLQECEYQAAAGARELVLTGINLGAYNSEGADLPALVSALRSAVPNVRIRISSVEPKDVSQRLIDVLQHEQGMVARHLHLPLQSGSSKVLREMARPYSAHEYLGLVHRIYEAVPNLSLSTDIICGFPGETDEDFQDTLNIAEACKFSKIHVFRYSKRADTPAAARTDQVPAHIIAERAHMLSDLGDRLRREGAEARQGSIENVLVEGDGLGMSESYYSVHTGDLPTGSLLPMKLVSVDASCTWTAQAVL